MDDREMSAEYLKLCADLEKAQSDVDAAVNRLTTLRHRKDAYERKIVGRWLKAERLT